MYKPIIVTLVLTTTACATTNDKPAASAEEAAAPPTQSPSGAWLATSKDGTRIAFEKAGQGPALVIVGGALSDRKGGKGLVPPLAEQFTVYTFDRRGRGESGDQKPYAVEREIEDLAAVIEQAGGKANVYGVSSGAALSLLTTAELGPTKVQKLALYEPPYGEDEKGYQEQKERVGQLVKTGQPGDAASFFLSSIGMPPPALEEMKRSPQWETMKKLDFTLVYDFEVLGDGSVPSEAKSVKVPTLVLDGEKSMDLMRPSADRVAAAIPNAQRKTLPGQTHQAAPEAVAPVLIQFFKGG